MCPSAKISLFYTKKKKRNKYISLNLECSFYFFDLIFINPLKFGYSTLVSFPGLDFSICAAICL